MRLRALAPGFVAAGLLVAGPIRADDFSESGYPVSWMVAWATSVTELQRGPVDVAEPGVNASFGEASHALGASTSNSLHVVSLGDGGHLTLHFASGIGDGPGDDFAVYENGFYSGQEGHIFGELAFVEVSSDGQQFARFDATTTNPDPVSGPDGDLIDPYDYHNLGGKHVLGEGTGFDLSLLREHALVVGGQLDLSNVSHVRLVDVIGNGTTFDHLGNEIYDPYATPFESGGFDADAVGVLHVGPEPGALAARGACLAALGVLLRLRRMRSCELGA